MVGRPRRVPRVGPGEAAADADRQAAAYNRSRLRTVVVAALTTNTRLAALPGNVFVPAATAGLDQDSVVNVTQLATVDRSYLDSRIGALPGWLLDEVDSGLRRVLALH